MYPSLPEQRVVILAAFIVGLVTLMVRNDYKTLVKPHAQPGRVGPLATIYPEIQVRHEKRTSHLQTSPRVS